MFPNAAMLADTSHPARHDACKSNPPGAVGTDRVVGASPARDGIPRLSYPIPASSIAHLGTGYKPCPTVTAARATSIIEVRLVGRGCPVYLNSPARLQHGASTGFMPLLEPVG